MSEELPRRRLGRGLAALLGEAGRAEAGAPEAVPDATLALDAIVVGPDNPRQTFDESELEELAASIRVHGVLQPLLVRPLADGRHELVAGERRLRAARRAGLAAVPVVVRPLDDRAAREIALIENVQRTDLDALEEAAGYGVLIERHGYGQGELAAAIGKSRSHVANTLRLLKLPGPVLDMVRLKALSAGHARALLTAPDPEALAAQVVRDGLTVRETERLAEAARDAAPAPGRRRGGGRPAKSADTRALEKRVADRIGLSVDIRHGAKGGEMRVAYRTLDQLDAICRLLTRP